LSRPSTPPSARRAPRETAAAGQEAAKRGTSGFRLLDPRAPYLLPLVTLLVTRAWLARAIPTASEDAYITFRYAANWAAGMGPVFNPGEHVLGFTSPLWTALLALGMALGQDPVVWARGFAVSADVVLILTMASLLERHASRTAAWVFGMFWAGYPFFAAVAVSGLETGVVVALVAVTAWCIDRKSPAAGVALGALALSRPEGFVMALVLMPWASRRDRLVGGGMALAGVAALALYFGSPVPQSMLAKASLYGTPGPWAGRHWWEWIVPMPMSAGAASSEGANLRVLSVLLCAAFVGGVLPLWRARRSVLAGAAVALVAVWLGYAMLGVAYFYWYLALPLAAAVLVAAVGFGQVTRGPLIPAATIVSAAGLWLFAGNLYVGRTGIESQVFLAMSDLIQKQSHAGESILLEPIGMIGWRNRSLRVVDEMGLVSPALAKRRRGGPGWYADVVTEQRPDWLLSRRGVLVKNVPFAGAGTPFRSFEERDRVLADYRVAAAQDTLIGDQAWVIYHRASATPNTSP